MKLEETSGTLEAIEEEIWTRAQHEEEGGGWAAMNEDEPAEPPVTRIPSRDWTRKGGLKVFAVGVRRTMGR